MSSSGIFLDSSILIEYYKGSKTELLDVLLNEISPGPLMVSAPHEVIIDGEVVSIGSDIETQALISLYISQTVLSEYLFQCLKLNTGKAPLTLKESGKIPEVISLFDHSELLSQFTYLPGTFDMIDLAPSMMQKYNLLPNDALILSICKIHEVKALASHDVADFVLPCQAEGIALVQNVADFEAYKKTL